MKPITEELAMKAHEFLVETDEKAAILKGLAEDYKERRSSVLAVEYMKVKGDLSQGDRQRMAEASEAYREHLDKYKGAKLDYEILKNRRESAVRYYEMWRSLNANRRQGGI